MRRQAAIVVVIGFCVCLALVFYERLDSSIAIQQNALARTKDRSTIAEIKETIIFFRGVEVAVGIWLLVVVGLLTGFFVHFGRKQCRSRVGRTPTDRLIRHRTPVQFSILTLLALMLSVGMVFATIRILFLAPPP